MRDRLIELLKKGQADYSRRSLEEIKKILYEKHKYNSKTDKVLSLWEELADYLLDNGVIVPPCKVGDETFLLLERSNGGFDIVESRCVKIIDNGYGKVFSMWFDCPIIDNTLEFRLDDFGKTVFLTKEEAEQALQRKAARGNEKNTDII